MRRAVFVTNNSFGAKNNEYSAKTNANEYRPVEFIRIRRIRIYCHPWSRVEQIGEYGTALLLIAGLIEFARSTNFSATKH
jgi:hypothetical protein